MTPTDYALQFEQQVAHSDEALAWLERIEIRCAAAWAEAYAAGHGEAHLIAASSGGNVTRIPSSDERDWRRAWIEVRSRKFGTVPQWRD